MDTQNKSPLKRLTSIRGMGQVITVTIGLIVLCVIFWILSPEFFSGKNVSNLLRQTASILIIGIGQSYVLITGNIDLSIGSVIGMSCMVSATLMCAGVHPALAVLITIVLCVVFGLFNGFLVAFCKLPPFIATLGTMTVARGIAQLPNYNTDSIGNSPAAIAFRRLFYSGGMFFTDKGIMFSNPGPETNIIVKFSIFTPVIIALVLWLAFNFVLSRTRTGRHIYAVGSNVEAAKLSGVNVVRTISKAYVVSAFCACIAGLITCATTGMGTMDAGNGYETYAVASSVIGGVSTLGGQGILLGTVIGASIWQVLQNGLSLANAGVAIRNIVIGIIVVVSVLLDVVVRKGTPKRNKTAKNEQPECTKTE